MRTRTMMSHGCTLLALAACLSACSGGNASGVGDASTAPNVLALDTQPSGKGGWFPSTTNGMNLSGLLSYHGGPVMLGQKNIYYIWYGNWQGNSATTILTDLAKSIGGSPYFNINASYSDGSGQPIANTVTYAGSSTDNYSEGHTLSAANVELIVSFAVGHNLLPYDTSGVYFVLTSPDVTFSDGFCTQYCGWHTHAGIDGFDLKYSLIPDAATQCPSSCLAQSATSPNGNVGADGMASVLAHELDEAVTDPDLNAWYDASANENADRCAWTFGTTYRAANGSNANVHLGSRDFLIQQNFVNTNGGYCAMSYTCTPNPNACEFAACGTVSDGCGGTLSCGTCGRGSTCVANVCQCNARKCSAGLNWDPSTCSCIKGLPK